MGGDTMRSFSWGEHFVQDIRFGARRLSTTTGFTAMAALSLALGIGASTAIYSVVNAVILNPFPYKDVDTLMSVRVWEAGRQGGRTGYTPGQFLEIAERNSIFEAVIASTISDVLWLGQGEPQRLRGNHVTRDTFAVMGVPALLGRVLVPSDFSSGLPPLCIPAQPNWRIRSGDPVAG